LLSVIVHARWQLIHASAYVCLEDLLLLLLLPARGLLCFNRVAGSKISAPAGMQGVLAEC